MGGNGSLVLTLREGEAIRVGDATIIYKEPMGRRARLVVKADRSVPIYRLK